jgi:hypothetical protein
MPSLLLALRRFIIDLFGKKSPMGFDNEVGWWTQYDVNISSSEDEPPKPLIINDCDKSYVVYSAVIHMVDTCDAAAKHQALKDAIDKVTKYFNNEFRCESRKCTQKTATLLWVGMSCHDNPTTATGAALFRFRCTVEF